MVKFSNSDFKERYKTENCTEYTVPTFSKTFVKIGQVVVRFGTV